ncbi:hypothetical protein SAMN05421736_105239 [Evansella caseinilytica]|uniref:Uncharacterized protein n=1 Tax=Evansella caseinilytica TaxID=1503961 RepID=A0A1H3PWW9_9BACI|nr:hypothetical protein [Evansella caseinilytica]SDZ05305.1 hypothetical protein SAMN05421736_105239 [Evansella caseinilytica]
MADMHEKNTKNKVMQKGAAAKQRHQEEKAPGYGDKKLEGPNRPSE